ncbi:nucleolar and coiled-body phosphoprotein 1-like [Paramacrobiotus metropolitanus]|uniref:nucleolar and coiled-body phosphoprotein 1-like n=1 Tax=Paramacrobiotus metropolitanus TaxID=2943436 RepID=UPI0024460D8E|nr:nucleolar and coiled-body phosphoprotein 1-like [Paramacrobiotus metropolitanus]
MNHENRDVSSAPANCCIRMRASALSNTCARIRRTRAMPIFISHFLLIVLSFLSLAYCDYTTTDGPTTTPEPPITWFDCPDQYSYHPHPANCTQYIICVFGKAYLRACEGGLNWNDQLKICDWPNPKTTCQQVDENTAYRPVASPTVTAPPLSDDDNSQRDDYQTETQGRYRGSQGFSHFKPDEDAAKDQLTSFAGKKVVYFDAPTDASNGDASASDNSLGSTKPDGDDGGQPAPGQDMYSSEQRAPPKKKSAGPQVMPIGQLSGFSSANRGAPQRMSSWDTGNDDFPQGDGPDSQQAPMTPPAPPAGKPKRGRAPMSAQASSPSGGNPPPWAQVALQRKKGGASSYTPPDDAAQDIPAPIKSQPPKGNRMDPPPWLQQQKPSGRSPPRNAARNRGPDAAANGDETEASLNRPQNNFPPKQTSGAQRDYQPPPRRTSQPDQNNRNAPSDNRRIMPQTYQPDSDNQVNDGPPPRSSQQAPSQGFIPNAPPRSRQPPQGAAQSAPRRASPSSEPTSYQGNMLGNSKPRSQPPPKPSNRRGPTDFSSNDAGADFSSRRQQRPVFGEDQANPQDRPRFPNPASTNSDDESSSSLAMGQPERINSRPPPKVSRMPPPPSRQVSGDGDDESQSIPSRFGPPASQSDDQMQQPRPFSQQRNGPPSSSSKQRSSQSRQRPPTSQPQQVFSRAQSSSFSSDGDSEQWSSGFSKQSQRSPQPVKQFGSNPSVLDEVNDGPSKIGAHTDEDSGPDGPSSFDIPKRIWGFGSRGQGGGPPDMFGPPPQPPGFGVFSGDSGDDQPSGSNFDFHRYREFYEGI